MSIVEQLKERLTQALEINKILKRTSLADWRDGVDIFSTQTGEPISVRYDYDENSKVTGVNYVVPLDNNEVSHQTPLEDGINYLASQNLFESEDQLWGEDLASKLQNGYLMTSNEAKEALQRLGKYADKLPSDNLQVLNYQDIAHRYDPEIKPTKVINGRELGSPFGDPDTLESALNQKPEPSKVSQLLAKNGKIWLTIGQSFQNRNSDLDGLDVISAAASLGGAMLLVLGAAAEKFRSFDAQRFNPDGELAQSQEELNQVATDFKTLDAEAVAILAARGETVLDKKIALTGDSRKDLAQLSKALLARQSVLIQGIDPTRMPQPLEVDGSNESLRQAIASLKVRSSDLRELVSDTSEKEQPLLTLDGAIQAQHLYGQVQQFFAAREEANQRLFNPNFGYQLQTKQGLTLNWNAQQFQVTEARGKSLLHIVKDDSEKFKVVGSHPSPTLVTALTHLPTTSESIRRLAAESNLCARLNEIAPFYSDKQLRIQASKNNAVTELCTFQFDENQKVIAIDGGGNPIWHHHQGQVILDRMPLQLLEKISSQLSRPLAATQSNSLASNPLASDHHQPILSL